MPLCLIKICLLLLIQISFFNVNKWISMQFWINRIKVLQTLILFSINANAFYKKMVQYINHFNLFFSFPTALNYIPLNLVCSNIFAPNSYVNWDSQICSIASYLIPQIALIKSMYLSMNCLNKILLRKTSENLDFGLI